MDTCKFCDDEVIDSEWLVCYDHCPTDPDGKHELLLPSLSWVDEDVFDVNCRHCGTSGSFTLLLDEKDVNW